MFWGFRSLWIMPLACRTRMAPAICCRKTRIVSSLSVPLAAEQQGVNKWTQSIWQSGYTMRFSFTIMHEKVEVEDTRWGSVWRIMVWATISLSSWATLTQMSRLEGLLSNSPNFNFSSNICAVWHHPTVSLCTWSPFSSNHICHLTVVQHGAMWEPLLFLS